MPISDYNVDWVAVAIGLFLGFWFLLSVLHQLRLSGWVAKIKYRDFFAMIPSWGFFGPNPGTTDVNLLYRDKLSDGTVTSWRHVRWATRFIRFFWNPNKRLQKGITDMGADLQRFAANNIKHAERIIIYPSFLSLLNYVSKQPHTPSAEYVQFALARSYGHHSDQQAQVEFVSNFHRL